MIVTRTLISKILFIISGILMIGCESIFFKPDPIDTPENNFEIFWKDFDLYYAQFKIRNINWDSVYSVYRPQIGPKTTDYELYSCLSKIVRSINDMHVNLITQYQTANWKGWGYGKYPSGRSINLSHYARMWAHQISVIDYYELYSSNIEYLIINDFEGETNDDRFLIIDEILDRCKNKDGIIIDVRWNGGGSSTNALNVANRFADKKRLCGLKRYKEGTGENDFSEWFNLFVEPQGAFQFLKPVVVLTSRRTGSSAEYFVMDMMALPHVTIVGDTTGGGTGRQIFRELPNGWAYRMSVAYAATPDTVIVDGKGISPDITVQTSVEDSILGIDRMLEKAIDVIQASKK